MTELVETKAYLVEDDPDLGIIFEKALTAADYKVRRFQAAEGAWFQLHVEKPQLVLLDLNLPGMSGVEFLHRLRNHEQFNDVKVVVASANHLLAETTRELAQFRLCAAAFID